MLLTINLVELNCLLILFSATLYLILYPRLSPRKKYKKIYALFYLSFAVLYAFICSTSHELYGQYHQAYAVLSALMVFSMTFSFLTLWLSFCDEGFSLLHFLGTLPAIIFAIMASQVANARNSSLNDFVLTHLRTLLILVYWALQVLIWSFLSKTGQGHIKEGAHNKPGKHLYAYVQIGIAALILIVAILIKRVNIIYTINILLILSLAATAAFLAYLPGFAFQKHSSYKAGSIFDHLYQQRTVSGLLANNNQPTLPDTYSKPILTSLQSRSFLQQEDIHPLEVFTKLPPGKKQTQLNDPQLQEIKERLQKLIQEDKVFLKKRYTITELSTQMQISVHLLSAFINQQFGMNFNDFINRLRISYSKELIDSGNATQLNIFGLAAKCGFNNRNTFTTAFKKYTGECPSEYLNKNLVHTIQPTQ